VQKQHFAFGRKATLRVKNSLSAWKGGISLHSDEGAQSRSAQTLAKVTQHSLLLPKQSPFSQGGRGAARQRNAVPSDPSPRDRSSLRAKRGALEGTPTAAQPHRSLQPTPPQDGGCLPRLSAAARRLPRARGPPKRVRGGDRRGPTAGGGRRARTHVSPWTTRQLPDSRCIPLSHWLPCEPFTFYPASAANRLARFIAWGWGACEPRRVEFSERACVAGVGRPPLVWVGGVGEVLRFRRASSARGKGGGGGCPGPR